MAVQDIMKSIADHLNGVVQVNAVFGESRVIGRKTIIPIAMTGVGFGAGGGKTARTKEAEAPAQEGGGGGGGGGTKPLAVLEVTDEETKIVPVIDLTRVIITSIFVGGCMVCMTMRTIVKLSKK